MKSAIGIVIARLNVPHGEFASALTTTSASTASRITMIARTATSAAAPPTGPISSRAICPRLLPSRRIEKHRTARAGGAAGRGQRGEVVAEQPAPVGRLEVDVVVQALGRRRAVPARAEDLVLDEARVEAVRDHIGPDGG